MNIVSLLYTVLELAVVGFVVYLIVTYIPMPAIFKNVLLVIVAIVVILWFLSQFGGFTH
jgi:hypothetical protein